MSPGLKMTSEKKKKKRTSEEVCDKNTEDRQRQNIQSFTGERKGEKWQGDKL